jgi:hypothetical protein
VSGSRGALALSGGLPGAVLAPPAASSSTVPTSPTTFGRIFHRLPPFAPATDAVWDALRELGAMGGPLDAGDDLTKRLVLLITDPSPSANNPINPTTRPLARTGDNTAVHPRPQERRERGHRGAGPLRELTWSLPSRQRVTRTMRLPVLTDEELGGDLDGFDPASRER